MKNDTNVMDYDFVDHHIEILNHHRDNSKTFCQGSKQENNKEGVSKGKLKKETSQLFWITFVTM